MSTYNRKRAQPFLKVFDELGIEIVDTEMTGSCHYKFKVTACGNCKFFIASYSSSDHRALMNFRSDVKRWKSQLEQQ
jgi:hypothetical protein